jgi:hypothetical protein
MGNGNKVFRKTMGMEFIEQAFGISSGIRRTSDWSLWKFMLPFWTLKEPG